MSRLIGTLEQALSYQHEGVVARFMDEFAVSREEAEKIFLETKRWLWLNSKHLDDLNQDLPNVPRSLGIRISITIIDEMWHTFILFTDDYANFCEKFLGQFIPHLPLFEREEEKTQIERDQEFIQYLSYLYDYIGEESLTLWFKKYPLEYSLDQIDTLRIHAARKRMCERSKQAYRRQHRFFKLGLTQLLSYIIRFPKRTQWSKSSNT
ncbi:hypothetical protein H6F74_26770 [Trichocoleus sp. FACHB-90]|uniref:glycine-rich domain-containing protein n=1 Tax=Cyanophyceae TaxID=3028117 RepID=UPI00168A2303|nr:hypothetical protein [Trichocoleus sp. FACHB-90]MBD1929810.1 hypothetical protein [Trichocoleus sp. FACHB-90]